MTARAASAAAAPRGAGLVDFNRRRKEGSRERLLAAAAAAFCDHGYPPVSIDDIASAAGVSRMTFYRHFAGKAEVASVLFRDNVAAAMPRLLAIGASDYRDEAAVCGWIAALFAEDRASRALLRVFTQASDSEPSFAAVAHRFIDDMVVGLGRTIPAFALSPDTPGERRRWIEAWLLIYEILDQSNHAAMGSGVATDPLMPEILAARFLRFVGG